MGSKTSSKTPFRYPKSKHTRRLRPGRFEHHSHYKLYLREEFERQCVYCRMPDAAAPLDSFGVDHYQPKTIFPERRNDYSNLFYCCNTCNRLKGDYWPTGSLEQTTRFVPNPCDHLMWSHLRFRDLEVNSRSEAGRFALELLNLNDVHEVGRRRMISQYVASLFAKIRDAMFVRTKLLDLAAVVQDAKLTEVTKKIDRAEAAITQLLNELSDFFPDLHESEFLRSV